MAIARAVTSEIAEFNFEALLQEVAQIKKIIIDAGVHLEDDFVRSQSEKIGKKFVDQVKQNLAAGQIFWSGQRSFWIAQNPCWKTSTAWLH